MNFKNGDKIKVQRHSLLRVFSPDKAWKKFVRIVTKELCAA